MKKFILVILFLTLCVPAYAADQILYVRDCDGDSSCGTGAGTSWTNPYDTLDSAESAVDRASYDAVYIYVADGSYAATTFNASASGTKMVYIKKATVAEHGTATGWDNSYGDGQATINGQVNFASNYWTLDGVSRTTEISGHGIKIIGATGSNTYNVYIDPGDNVTIKYVEMTSPNVPIEDGCSAANTCTGGGLRASGGADNIIVEYCYIHDVALPLFLALDGNGFTFRYSVAERNDSTPAAHSEFVSISYGTRSNVFFYNNKLIDMEGTAFIAVMNYVQLTNLYAYNNISYYTAGATQTGVGNGWFACTNPDVVCENVYIYNNTIMNLPYTEPGTSARINIDSVTGATAINWVVKNNLWFCNDSPCAGAGNDVSDEITYDNNWYGGVSYTGAENGAINGSSEDPFTNSATYDFTLKSEATTIGAATDLSALFTIDYSGATRSSWDIGAYEYGASGGDTTPIHSGGIFGGCVLQ
jgi:hypothetical protein